MTYELLPHTADIRAAIRGASPIELYGSGTDLVRHVLVGPSPVSPQSSRRVRLPDASEAERFFCFIRELLYLYDAEAFIPCAVDLSRDPVVGGERFDRGRHTTEHHVKAVTRHGYRYESSGEGTYVELILDV